MNKLLYLILFCNVCCSIGGFAQRSCRAIEEDLYLNHSLRGELGADAYLDSLRSCGNESPASVMVTARYFYRQQTYERSAQEFMRVFNDQRSSNDQRGEACYYMGLCYYNLGQSDKSSAFSQAALDFDYRTADCYYNIALAMFQKGDYREAIANNERAVALRPTYNEAWNNIGTCYDRLGMDETAFLQYIIADSLVGGSDPLYKSNQVRSLRGQDKYEEAFKLTTSNYERFPESEYVMEDYAFMLGELGYVSEAIALSRKLLLENPENDEAWFRIGYSYDHQGQHDSAYFYYARAIHSNPTLAHAYYNSGVILKIWGQIEKAHEYYDIALQLDPNVPVYYQSKSNAYLWQHRFAECHEWAVKYYERWPKGHSANVLMGYSLQQLGRFEEAVPYYIAELQKHPEDDKLYNNLGRCYAELGQFEKAKTNLEQALLLNAENCYTYHNRAAYYYDQGQFDLACADLRTAMDKQYNWLIDEKLEKMKAEHCKDVNTNRKLLLYSYRGNEEDLAHMDFIQLSDSIRTLEEVDHGRLIEETIVTHPKSMEPVSDMFSNYRCYPNPTLGRFTVQTTEALEEHTMINIYNSLGNLVKSVSMTASAHEIELSGMAEGAYVVMIVNDHTVLSTQKIVLAAE